MWYIVVRTVNITEKKKMSGKKDSDDDHSPRLKVSESYKILWSVI